MPARDMVHHYDCESCVARGVQCQCPVSLRHRSAIDLRPPARSPEGPYDDSRRFLWHMRKPAVIEIGDHRLRITTQVGPKITATVVQEVLTSIAGAVRQRVGYARPRLVPRGHSSESAGAAVSSDPRAPPRDDNRSHQCAACGKPFLYASKLKRHVVTKHERAKNHKNHSCGACGNKFSQKAHLDAPMRHLHEKAQKLSCPECSDEFLWQSSLNRHVMRKHKLSAPTVSTAG